MGPVYLHNMATDHDFLLRSICKTHTKKSGQCLGFIKKTHIWGVASFDPHMTQKIKILILPLKTEQLQSRCLWIQTGPFMAPALHARFKSKAKAKAKTKGILSQRGEYRKR